jgi:hypothetical protein
MVASVGASATPTATIFTTALTVPVGLLNKCLFLLLWPKAVQRVQVRLLWILALETARCYQGDALHRKHYLQLRDHLLNENRGYGL